MPPTLPKKFDHRKFLAVIDQNVELRGMRVVLYDGAKMRVLREGPPICEPGLKSIVIKPDVGETALQSPSAAQARESHLYLELISGAMGCTGAVVSWMVVLGGSGAAPITGGTSMLVAGLAWTGAVSGTLQCGNSMVRIYGELADGDLLSALDSNEWYTGTVRAMDGISLVGAGVGAFATVRMVYALRATTGKTMAEVLKGLSRQERKKLAEELIRRENPSISNSALKALVAAGKYPKRFSMQSVSQAVRNQLKDALNAALGISGSAMSGLIREGGNYVMQQAGEDDGGITVKPPGSTGGYVVGIAQTFDTY
jgi:hypothetical protein